MPQRAEAAQHGRDHLADQRAVAIRQGGQPRAPVLQLLVERPVPAQHAFEHIGGDLAYSETGR